MYRVEKYAMDLAKRIDDGKDIEKASLMTIWDMGEDIEEDMDQEEIGHLTNDQVNFSTLILKAQWNLMTRAFKESRGVELNPELVEKHFPSDEFKCTSEDNLYDKWRDAIMSVYDMVEAEIEAEIEAKSPDMSPEELIAFCKFLQNQGMI